MGSSFSIHLSGPELPPKLWKTPPQTQSVGTQCGSSLSCRPCHLPTHSHHYWRRPLPGSTTCPVHPAPPVEVDAQTESNHDTALTVACAGGHKELVQMLMEKCVNMEHKDMKGELRT